MGAHLTLITCKANQHPTHIHLERKAVSRAEFNNNVDWAIGGVLVVVGDDNGWPSTTGVERTGVCAANGIMEGVGHCPKHGSN